MTVAELVLVRHGESMGNLAAAAAQAADAEVIEVDRRDADVELSGLGRDQARALGGGLRPLLTDGRATHVWSSPYVRARQTAEQFARQCAATPLRRGTSPEEVAAAAIALLHLRSVTGQMLALDGGQHLNWSPARESALDE